MSDTYLNESGITALKAWILGKISNNAYDLVTAEDAMAWFVAAANQPGTYDANGNMLKSWEQLINDGDIEVDNGVLTVPETWRERENAGETVDDLLIDGARIRFAGVDTLIIPDSVTAIGVDTNNELLDDKDVKSFHYCEDLRQVIHQGVLRYIGYGAFQGCKNLSVFNMAEGLERIGNSAFVDCVALSDISIPSTVRFNATDFAAFAGCSFETIVIPDGNTVIPYGMFKSCKKLKNVILPNGLKTINDQAFSSCSSLEEILIPSSVDSIGGFTFFLCSNLTTIHYSGTATGAPWRATNATVVP